MLSNTKVKYIKSLCSKKNRLEEKHFFVEGEKIVSELLNFAPELCVEIFATEKWQPEIQTNTIENKLNIIDEKEMQRISQLKSPSDVLAIVKMKDEKKMSEVASGITLVLDTIQDPGNLGTIIRIADWFGVKQIICSEDCADQYNPKVVQTTMGSIFRVNVFYNQLVVWLKKQNSDSIYATTLQGENIYKMEKIKNGILVIGNESQGIDEGILKYCKNQITIPRKGNAESLNAAVATGIVLSHLSL